MLDLQKNAVEFAQRAEITLDLTNPLGFGNDGTVWRSFEGDEVKSLERENKYTTELECYRRLKAARIVRIGDFTVPELIAYSDELLVIEMRLVTAPYLLDFAKVWLDHPPIFPDEH